MIDSICESLEFLPFWDDALLWLVSRLLIDDPGPT